MLGNHLTRVAVSGLVGMVLSLMPSGLPQARPTSSSLYQLLDTSPAEAPEERTLTNQEKWVRDMVKNIAIPNAKFCGMYFHFNSDSRTHELSFAYSLPTGLPIGVFPNVFVIYNNPKKLGNGMPIITPFQLPDALIIDNRTENGNVFQSLEPGVYSFPPSPALDESRVNYFPTMPKKYKIIAERLTILCQ